MVFTNTHSTVSSQHCSHDHGVKIEEIEQEEKNEKQDMDVKEIKDEKMVS